MKKLSERKKRWIERTIANNRSYKVWLYNRLFLFLLLVLGQIVGYVLLMYLFANNSQIGVAVQVVVGILELIFVVYIVNKYDTPAVKLVWILLILIFPLVGVPAYLMFGEGRSIKKTRKKILAAQQENERQAQAFLGEVKTPELYNQRDSITRYVAERGGYPVYYDGDVTYYKNGEEMFPEMLAELQRAKKYILVEYFIIAHGKMWNSILKILLEKAIEGVQVRVLYDDFGCMVTLPPNYDRYLEGLHENIRCVSFNQVVPLFALRMNNRDHRKILVVDGQVAFTGGINLADEYIGEVRRFGYWKDTGIKIVGPAVNSFIKMFFYLWNSCREDKERVEEYLLPEKEEENVGESKLRIQPYDDSPLDDFSIGESVYADIVSRANKYVYIFTPYLILDDYMRNVLCMAALRGVDVRIVTPAVPDKKTVYRLTRANYGILMQAGVKIYEYTPGFIHAKSMVCDDEVAVVGTINLDYRSLFLHFENAVYFTGVDAVMDVKRDVEETIAVSELCTKENTKRSWMGRVIDSFLRIFEILF